MTNEKSKLTNEEIYLKCIFCKKVVEWKKEELVFKNGTKHIRGTCPLCGYIKYLPQEKSFDKHIFYFGKHKGKNITEVPKDYLEWCLKEDIVGGGLRLAIKAFINK
ncbi:MAG: hypothetical protein ABII98_01390 [bacterium]